MKGRAQKEHERTVAEQPLVAHVQETFNPARINVAAPDPGQAGPILLQLFIGPTAQANVFQTAKIAAIDPDTAIAIGEYLVKEGRRIRSGLVVASGGPADLRA